MYLRSVGLPDDVSRLMKPLVISKAFARTSVMMVDGIIHGGDIKERIELDPAWNLAGH